MRPAWDAVKPVIKMVVLSVALLVELQQIEKDSLDSEGSFSFQEFYLFVIFVVIC